MTNLELLEIATNLKNNINDLKKLQGAKFTYGIVKNINIIEKEMAILTEVIKPTNEYITYDTKRIQLCEKYAKKDENDKPIKNSNGYDIDVNSKDWIKSITKLKEEYSEIISQREKQISEYNKLLECESDVIFHMINMNDVPDQITLELMQIIQIFIFD